MFFQLSEMSSTRARRVGPRADDADLKNCPNVSEEVRRRGSTTSPSRGFTEVCMRVLPMPANANAMSMCVNV